MLQRGNHVRCFGSSSGGGHLPQQVFRLGFHVFSRFINIFIKRFIIFLYWCLYVYGTVKISEQIRLAIEDDIRNGVLLPGDAIDEHELALQFNVSRTPVREALLQLKVQGMLNSLPRNGMTVAKMDVQELLSVWELLGEMEAVAARMACQRMTPQERAELARIHAQAATVIEAEDAEGWRQANHDFHEVLYKGCRNPYLRQELLRLRARTAAYLKHAFTAVGRIRESYEQHDELLQAILAGDAALAQQKMSNHISLAQSSKGLADFLINLPRSMLAQPDD